MGPLPSQRPRLTLRLIPGGPMVMVPIPMPMEDTGHTAFLMSTATTERDLLMPSLRQIPPSSTPPMVPIPMLTLDSITAALDTTLDTLMPTTTERDLLMPSLRLMLMPSFMDILPIIPMLTLDSTAATLDTTLDTLMPTMERGPPMLSPRLMLMPTTDITDMALGPMLMATATVATGDTTGDKSSLRVPSKSSTRTSLLVNLTFHPSVRLLGGVGN